MKRIEPVLVMLLALGAGCPVNSGGGDTPSGGAGTGSHTHDGVTLQEACAASCQAQAATHCPGVLSVPDCTEYCLELQGTLHCPDAWRDLNDCMAEAPLSCDRVNGGASVSSKDCGPELEAFSQCT